MFLKFVTYGKLSKDVNYVHRIGGENLKILSDADGNWYIVFNLPEDSDVKLNKSFVPINKKGTTYFTINGLNLLLKQEYNQTAGYKIPDDDWYNKYSNKLVLSRNNEIVMIDYFLE